MCRRPGRLGRRGAAGGRGTITPYETFPYLWRSPTGHWCQVDHRGTTYLGKDRPAALDKAERLNPTGMTRLETRLRELVLRGLAA